eukprot:356690-Chlamydomonas_euryale.AAC.17
MRVHTTTLLNQSQEMLTLKASPSTWRQPEMNSGTNAATASYTEVVLRAWRQDGRTRQWVTLSG